MAFFDFLSRNKDKEHAEELNQLSSVILEKETKIKELHAKINTLENTLISHNVKLRMMLEYLNEETQKVVSHDAMDIKQDSAKKQEVKSSRKQRV